MRANVLGTEYEITEVDRSSDPILKDSSGYCDKTVRKIILDNMESTKKEYDSVKNMESEKKDTLRHELIHAFLNESGLASQCEWNTKEMVDWVALQFPKMMKAMIECGCLQPYAVNVAKDHEWLQNRFDRIS
jgi:hypothetical protein